MKWIDTLDRKFRRFSIKGLILFIIAMNLAVFVFSFVKGFESLGSKILLIPELVRQGELWRLITFTFIPPNAHPLLMVFVLYFYYMIGVRLENEWGSFKLNLYYFMGMLSTILACFITDGIGSSVYLNMSLFLAYAKLYPNNEINMYMLVPVKVKYLAWLDLAYVAYTVLIGDMDQKLMAVASVLNYFVFSGDEIFKSFTTKMQVRKNRKRFLKEVREAEQNKWK